jgi:hypothetical protein
MSKTLKKRMQEKQLGRVDELVAATKPSARREVARLEAERDAVEALLEQEPAESETAPVEDASVEEAQPVVEDLPAAEPPLAGLASVAAVPTADPATVRGPVATRAAVPARTPRAAARAAGDQPWRRFVTPPAARGTAVNICRLNIPVSESAQRFLAQLDYDLKAERSRWVVNRNDLVTAAGEAFLADPQAWEAQYLGARLELEPTPATLQGRVTTELFDALDMARYSPNGKRPVGPVLAYIVMRLLGMPTGT